MTEKLNDKKPMQMVKWQLQHAIAFSLHAKVKGIGEDKSGCGKLSQHKALVIRNYALGRIDEKD
jgi:hypothetical protein